MYVQGFQNTWPQSTLQAHGWKGHTGWPQLPRGLLKVMLIELNKSAYQAPSLFMCTSAMPDLKSSVVNQRPWFLCCLCSEEDDVIGFRRGKEKLHDLHRLLGLVKVEKRGEGSAHGGVPFEKWFRGERNIASDRDGVDSRWHIFPFL